MKKNIIKFIIYTLAIIFFLDLITVLASPEIKLFVYPSGNDYEVGKAMGANSFRVIEIAVIIYAIIFYRKIKKEKKLNTISTKE